MRKPDAFIWVTTNEPAGLALITGRRCRQVLADGGWLADGTARWSASGQGYVVALPVALDIEAFCQYYGIPARRRAVGS